MDFMLDRPKFFNSFIKFKFFLLSLLDDVSLSSSGLPLCLKFNQEAGGGAPPGKPVVIKVG